MTDSSAHEETPYEFGRRLFAAGVAEFQQGGYFEAHDLWEEFWQELRGGDRLFLQGLIHLAVGTYHFQNGNLKGARSQLGKATQKLGRYPEGHWGVDIAPWRAWAAAVAGGATVPPPEAAVLFDPRRFPEHLAMAPR
jgi:hypothetical protein